MKLVKRVEIEKPQEVYNLHIKDDHNYVVDGAVVHNCHKGSAQVLQKLMGTATSVKYRTGWTGTLSNETINELQIKGTFGPVKTITTTRELMDKGIVAQLDIVVDRITYPVEISQEVALLDYNGEMAFIEKYGPREDHILAKIGRC